MSAIREFDSPEFGPKSCSMRLSEVKPSMGTSEADARFLGVIMLALVAAAITAGSIAAGLTAAYVGGVPDSHVTEVQYNSTDRSNH